MTLVVTDNQAGGGNTYNQVPGSSPTAGHDQGVQFHADHIASSGTFTVTITPMDGGVGTTTLLVVHLYEVSTSATSPFDQSGSNISNTTTANPTVSTSGATTTSPEIVLGSIASGTSATISNAGGYTIGEISGSTAQTGMTLWDFWTVVSSTGTQTLGPTMNTGLVDYSALISTYHQ